MNTMRMAGVIGCGDNNLSDQISWIGTGVNEICSSKKEAVMFFEEESRIYDGYFLIEYAWFHGLISAVIWGSLW